MTPDELKQRTKTFSIEVVKFARKLPHDIATEHVARQLARCGLPRKAVATLMDEAEQLLRIVVASIKTARGRSR